MSLVQKKRSTQPLNDVCHKFRWTFLLCCSIILSALCVCFPTCVVFIALCSTGEQLSHGGSHRLGSAAQVLSTLLQLQREQHTVHQTPRQTDSAMDERVITRSNERRWLIQLNQISLTDSPGSGFSCMSMAAILASWSSVFRVWTAVRAEWISMGPQASWA